jgi:glycerol-3-phosphate dehydrogenase
MIDRRALNIRRLREEEFDVLILGGGINGAGIARDLTLRDPGLRVALVEKNHFASGTSGRNSQLIHGGLRYLKYFEFHLVHEALRERTILLRIAPELVHPLQFLLPCYHAMDRWFYGSGLALYDLLGADQPLGAHHSLSRRETIALEPGLASDGLQAGLVFSDCSVNSARLVLENILDAETRGAAVANYVEVHPNGSTVTARDALSGEEFGIRARKLVDATGAWSSAAPLRLVRGSHLIFPRIQNGTDAISHFDDQGRIVFLTPWGENGDLTLVGTTDVDHDGTADDVHISAAETSYLTSIVHRLYPVYRGEPISSYSALRPLIAEGGRSATSTSREHRIWETADGILHIAGGKYTTYRAMSEELVDALLQDIAPGRTLPCRTAETRLNIPPVPQDPATRVRVAVEREFARRLTDVLHISTYWGYERKITRDFIEPIAREMAGLLGWDDAAIEWQISSI